MNIILGILLGLFCLIFLISAHEFGHFVLAKRNGIRVLEYGICFPPRAIAWLHVPDTDKKGKPILKKNGKPKYHWEKIDKKDWDKPQEHLIFSINWLPIGGFCQMDGESDADIREKTFGAATFWQKTKVLFGGVLFNWAIAFVILTILAWTGLPMLLPGQFHFDADAIDIDEREVMVSRIIENSPADRAGIKEGDIILSAKSGDQEATFTDTSSFIAFDDAHAGENVTYKIKRESEENTLELTAELNIDSETYGYIFGASVGSFGRQYSRYTWSAPIVGLATTIQLTGETYRGLGEALWNLISGAFSQFSFNDSVREAGRESLKEAGDSVTGPIGIIGVLFPAIAQTGLTNISFMLALISISLACMNVLPIPALDGGRFFMILFARLKHQRVTREREEQLVSRTMVGLLVFMAVVAVLDIIKLIR